MTVAERIRRFVLLHPFVAEGEVRKETGATPGQLKSALKSRSLPAPPQPPAEDDGDPRALLAAWEEWGESLADQTDKLEARLERIQGERQGILARRDEIIDDQARTLRQFSAGERLELKDVEQQLDDLQERGAPLHDQLDDLVLAQEAAEERVKELRRRVAKLDYDSLLPEIANCRARAMSALKAAAPALDELMRLYEQAVGLGHQSGNHWPTPDGESRVVLAGWGSLRRVLRGALDSDRAR